MLRAAWTTRAVGRIRPYEIVREGLRKNRSRTIQRRKLVGAKFQQQSQDASANRGLPGLFMTTALAAVSVTIAASDDFKTERSLVGGRISTVVGCEAPASSATGHDDDVPPPYENLPDEDVETDCFLCRTHRQGPCRDVWRNFEYCVKDHQKKDGEDDSSRVCDQYIRPFEQCWKQHLALYLLISLDVHTDDVRPIQTALRYHGVTLWEDLPLDWSEWHAHIRNNDDDASLRRVWSSIDKQVPYWKRFEYWNETPTVVNVSSVLPVHKEEDGAGRLGLCAAYAVDQDGLVLGHTEYDPVYEAAQQQLNANSGAPPPLPQQHKLLISVVPGMTEGVRVVAVYRVEEEEPESQEGSTRRNRGLRAFESRLVPVPTKAKNGRNDSSKDTTP